MSLSENGWQHAGLASIRAQGVENHALRAAVAVSIVQVIRLLRVSSFWGGALRALCVETNSGMPAVANSPPLSGNIALRPFMAKGCSTMKPNGVSEPGHRQPTLPGFS